MITLIYASPCAELQILSLWPKFVFSLVFSWSCDVWWSVKVSGGYFPDTIHFSPPPSSPPCNPKHNPNPPRQLFPFLFWQSLKKISQKRALEITWLKMLLRAEHLQSQIRLLRELFTWILDLQEWRFHHLSGAVLQCLLCSWTRCSFVLSWNSPCYDLWLLLPGYPLHASEKSLSLAARYSFEE